QRPRGHRRAGGGDQEPAVRLARECIHRIQDVADVSDGKRDGDDIARSRNGLYRAPVARRTCVVGIEDQSNPDDIRYQLLEKLDKLTGQRGLVKHEAGQIPAGMREAFSISLSSSSHFALMPNSHWVNPVAWAPGRAKLATRPEPTGSGVPVNTIGTMRLACCNGPTAAPPRATMTSGASATSSAAEWRMRSASPPPQRVSICK